MQIPSLSLLLLLLGLMLLSASHRLGAQTNPVGDEEPDWEYEPRIWSPDGYDNVEQQHQPDSGPQELGGLSNSYDDLGAQFDRQKSSAEQRDIRKRSYFWETRESAHLRQQEGERCSQFRVDIRETVICDRNRCDKLDFEWPVHENQLTVIESTRHGMRFHRADYAFDEAPSRFRGPQPANKEASRNRNKSSDGKIKFDLFELFKPSSTAAPSSSSTTTTTKAPTTEKVTTTEAEPETTTTPVTTTTTTKATTTTASQREPYFSTPGLLPPESLTKPSVSHSNQRQAGIESQDKNNSRLVTTFRLDTGRRMQTMLGFGGALSDSTCRNIKSLSPTMAKSLMDDYFGPRGLRYNIVRMTMGSSDFSTSPYTNNDRVEERQSSASGQSTGSRQGFNYEQEADDVEMKRFRLVEEDYDYKLPVARQAIATSRQEIKFFSSMWSPPIWMKNNSNIVHGYLKGDVYGPYYKALAELMIRWLEAYRKNGIEFWATTGLNEPVTGIKPFIFHNSLGISREDYVTFIKLYLGPMLRQRGFSNVKLIAMDDNKGYAPHLARALLSDQEAAKYIAGIGIHWYMNDEYENLNFLSKEFPDKFILSTEGSNGYLPFQVHTLPGDWDRGVAYMLDEIKVIQKNAVGLVDWNMALDLYGGPSWIKNLLDAPVIVNAERDEYYKSPMFYALGHFSRFVEPNSTRLDHRLANARYDYPLEAVGFLTPSNYIVIVALNANKHPVSFKIIVDRKLVKVVTLREESFNSIVFRWKPKQ